MASVAIVENNKVVYRGSLPKIGKALQDFITVKMIGIF